MGNILESSFGNDDPICSRPPTMKRFETLNFASDMNLIDSIRGDKIMDKEDREMARENNKKKIYFLLSRTHLIGERALTMEYTTSKSEVAMCLDNEGLVFALEDGRLVPVTSITITADEE